MKTMLIWVMINLSSGQPVDHFQYPTASDCQRAITVYNQAGRFNRPYKCQSIRTVDQTAGAYGYATPEDAMLKAAAQGRRNGDYNMQKLQSYEIQR